MSHLSTNCLKKECKKKNKIIPNKKKIKAVSIQSDHAHLRLSVFFFFFWQFFKFHYDENDAAPDDDDDYNNIKTTNNKPTFYSVANCEEQKEGKCRKKTTKRK